MFASMSYVSSVVPGGDVCCVTVVVKDGGSPVPGGICICNELM